MKTLRTFRCLRREYCKANLIQQEEALGFISWCNICLCVGQPRRQSLLAIVLQAALALQPERPDLAREVPDNQKIALQVLVLCATEQRLTFFKVMQMPETLSTPKPPCEWFRKTSMRTFSASQRQKLKFSLHSCCSNQNTHLFG